MRVLSGELCAHRICMKHLLLASFISSLYTEMTLTITPLHQKTLIANKVYKKYHIQKYMALHFLPTYNCFYCLMSNSGNQQPREALENVKKVECHVFKFWIWCFVHTLVFAQTKSAIYLAGFIG